MRRPAAHILLLLCVLAAGSGCGRRARVIPPRKMSRIYAEMFVADQWIRDNTDARRIADTTLFFDPIFRAHGVTFEDYDRSLHYYLDHPERYVKILSRVSERLRAESTALQALADASRDLEAERERYRRNYRQQDFSLDSLRWSGPGTLWPVWDGPVDSLRVPMLYKAADDTVRRRIKARAPVGKVDEIKIEQL